MYLTFKSVDSYGDEVKFEAPYEIEGKTYIFDDLSAENTKTNLRILDDQIEIYRVGDTESSFIFKENTKCLGHYKNNLGLEMKMEVFTKKINQLKDKLYIEYDLIISGDVISSHKIWILFH